MQNGSLKIGVVQNYRHTFPYLTTIYQLQVDILQTLNQLSNYKLRPAQHFCILFVISRQSGMGSTVFQKSKKGSERDTLRVPVFGHSYCQTFPIWEGKITLVTKSNLFITLLFT